MMFNKKISKYYTKFNKNKFKVLQQVQQKNSKYYTEFNTKIQSTTPSPTGVLKKSKYYTEFNTKEFKLQHQVGLRLVFNKKFKVLYYTKSVWEYTPRLRQRIKVLQQL